MIAYKWMLKENNLFSTYHKQRKIKRQDGSILHLRKILFFHFFAYIEPLQEREEFNRGTRHIERHITLSVGRMKNKMTGKEFSGVAFFDIHDKFFFVFLALLGVIHVSNSVVIGVFFAIVIYTIVSFILSKREREALDTLECICNQLYVE